MADQPASRNQRAVGANSGSARRHAGGGRSSRALEPRSGPHEVPWFPLTAPCRVSAELSRGQSRADMPSGGASVVLPAGPNTITARALRPQRPCTAEMACCRGGRPRRTFVFRSWPRRGRRRAVALVPRVRSSRRGLGRRRASVPRPASTSAARALPRMAVRFDVSRSALSRGGSRRPTPSPAAAARPQLPRPGARARRRARRRTSRGTTRCRAAVHARARVPRSRP